MKQLYGAVALFAVLCLNGISSKQLKEEQMQIHEDGERAFKERIVANTRSLLQQAGRIKVLKETGKARLIKANKGYGVRNQYVIRLKEGLTDKQVARFLETIPRYKGDHIKFNSETDIVMVKLTESEVEEVRKNTDIIEEIEQDVIVKVNDDFRSCHEYNVLDLYGLWGLDRVDKIRDDNRLLSWGNGSGIDVYIIDTGIRPSHECFAGGRVTLGFPDTSETAAIDDHGHGTHVAGTVGCSKYGIAKEVHLIAVKVLDGNGSGTSQGVLNGMYWVLEQVRARKRTSVVNMSLGGGYSTASNDAVAALVDEGIPVVVAAGNDNEDACLSSPSSAPKAITVGATTSSDSRADFSNYGRCVDIYAPGDRILSATNKTDTSTAVKSGTSMASPLVAGAVAALGSVFVAEGYFQENTPAFERLVNHYLMYFAVTTPGENHRLLHVECLSSS
ncbi:alkaline serine protease ver112-like [Lingula anatina]|uniref:Alkaline serine protease ver112-like n=1 Tax=Lingula anatina TaxID=7574 RepID=A0A1S3K5Z7_LINAN|nr:alkaline serine protease ver112-like [Lingula anatina]|eukprot:XP_013417676.1 alkaline serine protease ver112-like [Lingula anatina]